VGPVGLAGVGPRSCSARLLSAAAAFGLAGCILFVSPRDYGAHCRFANEESACGACLASKCATAIDACCRDEACDPTLALVEKCAAGDANGCTGLASELSAAGSSRIALAACFGDQCQVACRAVTPTTNITECSAPSFGRGQTCTCQVSKTPNATACDETAFPNTICCAPLGWPGAGLRCSCRALDCGPTADGCLCMVQDGPSGGTRCTGQICCQDHDVCSCGSQPCLSTDQVVKSCDFSTVGCAGGQQHVTSCVAPAK
jgi:hypothetical protein